MQNVLIIDGLNVWIRSYSVDQSLTVDGQKCGGIVGFLNCVKSWINKFNPDGIFVCWDGANGSIRKRKIFPEYKAQRKPFFEKSVADDADDVKNKIWQLQSLVAILKHFPVCQLYVDNCEADDIIFYLVNKLKDVNKLIISSDKDFYQLVSEKTKIYALGKKLVIKADDIVNEFKVLPENFVIYRSITGDASDNIDGVRGIGPVKFAKLLPELVDRKIETLNELKVILTDKKDAKYNVLTNEWNKLQRNYDLIKLNYEHLSLNQISKIDAAITSYAPKIELLNIRKKLIEYKISITYLESILTSFRQLSR